MSDETAGRASLRPYAEGDAAATLRVFTDAITQTASDDYSAEQIEAWARPGRRDLGAWHDAMANRRSIVAEMDGRVVGFSDVSDQGYIDMMFVAPEQRGNGIARLLLDWDAEQARSSGAAALTADVSRTARPFFERNGFTVTAEQRPVKEGVELVNFAMRKPLHPER